MSATRTRARNGEGDLPREEILVGVTDPTINRLTSLLVAGPSMPWPEHDQFIDQHLELCMRSFPPSPR